MEGHDDAGKVDLIPRSGLSEVTGMISTTMLRKTVRDIRIVIPENFNQILSSWKFCFHNRWSGKLWSEFLKTLKKMRMRKNWSKVFTQFIPSCEWPGPALGQTDRKNPIFFCYSSNFQPQNVELLLYWVQTKSTSIQVIHVGHSLNVINLFVGSFWPIFNFDSLFPGKTSNNS